jgi:hypothetical protein
MQLQAVHVRLSLPVREVTQAIVRMQVDSKVVVAPGQAMLQPLRT